MSQEQSIVAIIVHVQECWLGGFTSHQTWKMIGCVSTPDVIRGVFKDWDAEAAKVVVPEVPKL